MRAVLGLTIAATALGSVLGAQLSPVPATSLVRLDAVVTDAKGALVRGLAPGDFTIIEDGVAERVESATFVSVDAQAPAPSTVSIASREVEETEASRPGTRLFALYLDEYHVAAGLETTQAKEILAQFIERDMGPGDLAVVLKPLDSLLSVRLTHDKLELLAAVSSFEGRKGDYAPKNAFERNYVEVAPVRNEAVRAQIVTSALNALATHLGSLQPGRKTVVLVSDGFIKPPRRRDEALPTVESVVRTANRAGVSIYTVDPRAVSAAVPPPAAGAPQADDDRDHEGLRTLAEETDGRAVLTAADVASGMPHIASDSRGYYLLAFRPAHPADLRTFHHVELHVKPAGLSVHARKGYWSASPDDLLRAREERRASIPTPPPQPMRHVSPMIRPWFGVARAANAADGVAGKGLMQVSFVWQPVPPVPGDRIRRGPPALVSVRATKNTDGALVFAGDVRPSNAPAGPGDEVPNQVAFSAPPGRLLVQIQIQDADANVLDTDVRDVVVGGLAGPVEVGTPEVMRAANAREFRALAEDPEAVPTADRDFTRADHLLIRLPVYGGNAPLTVTAAVVSKPGNATRPLPVEAIAGTVLYQTNVSLGALVAGSYGVTITATGADGNASETVDFRVVP